MNKQIYRSLFLGAGGSIEHAQRHVEGGKTELALSVCVDTVGVKHYRSQHINWTSAAFWVGALVECSVMELAHFVDPQGWVSRLS